MDTGATKTEGMEEDGLRANLYSLLATLLSGPPSELILTRLRMIDSRSGDRGPMAAAWRRMKRAAEGAVPSDLELEYHALFVGLGRGELVPYGSWYQTGKIVAEPLAHLRADLAKLGISRRTGIFEAEDHAAPLCETMALICRRPESSAAEDQRRFFEAHIAGWMPKFFKDLQQAPSASFYNAVGALGEAFLSLEKQYLNI